MLKCGIKYRRPRERLPVYIIGLRQYFTAFCYILTMGKKSSQQVFTLVSTVSYRGGYFVLKFKYLTHPGNDD